MYTVPVMLAILVVVLTALIFWGALAEERRATARR